MTERKRQKKPAAIRSMAELSKFKIQFAEATDGETLNKEFAQREAYLERRKPTHNIISIVAYLLGVGKQHFENVYEPPQLEVYSRLDQDQDARIIRNLCMIRNAMEQKYKAISRAFYLEGKNIGTIPDLIPSEAVEALYRDNVDIYMGRPRIDDYLIKINQEISNRIGRIERLFPEWVRWAYVKPLFLMPNGTKPSGIREAGMRYNTDRNRYPYQCWLNWDAISAAEGNKGNVLYSDEKFLTLLYQRHEDRFENLSLVRDAGNQTMRNLEEMLKQCENCILVVDCENSDAVKLAAALSSLSKEELRRIRKILLFDSEYTTTQWATLVDRLMKAVRDTLRPEEAEESLRLEHIMVPRLNQSKSQVDMTLAVRTSREVYGNHAGGVILVSSDSDYWAMIRQLEGVRFLVMLEKEKAGLAIMDTLALHDIRYCFLDDFCIGASYTLKTQTLIDAMQKRINAILNGNAQEAMNVRDIMESCLHKSWIEMTAREKEAFFNRYLRRMELSVRPDGMVNICIR